MSEGELKKETFQQETRANANKRIAKNTIALYIRMVFAMFVSLYTSRVVLQTLGVEDFGTYNIVGGIVVLFAFLNNTMVGSIQRFLNFEIGKKNENGITDVFSAGFRVQIILAVVVFILAETIGLFYLNKFMKIPEGRLYAANWVFQFSILATCLRIIRVPFHAAVISYERMTVFAIISIVDVCFKLIIVYMLLILPGDKLIMYAALSASLSAGITFYYFYYTNKNFILCRAKYDFDRKQLNKMLGFSGWSLFGSISLLATFQGIDLILNYFHGVVVNAALAIANQVYAATSSFTGSFQMAFQPQITKTFARDDMVSLYDLVFKTTRYSFFLVIICAIPLLFQCKSLLSLWLGMVPDNTTNFCYYIILICVVDSLAAPLWMSAQATGNIKIYQIIVSSILILNFPITTFLMICGLPPVWAIIVRFFVCCCAFGYRVYYMINTLKMSILSYLNKVVKPCVYVFVPSTIFAFFFCRVVHLHTIFMSILLLSTTILIVLFIGLNKNERIHIKKSLVSKFQRK